RQAVTGSFGYRRIGAQIDLRNIARDRRGELNLTTRRVGEVEGRFDSALLEAGLLANFGRWPTPDSAPRLVAANRPGPWIADGVTRLKVVEFKWLRALFETAASHGHLAAADDRLRLLEHEVVFEVFAVARVQAREHEIGVLVRLRFLARAAEHVGAERQ